MKKLIVASVAALGLLLVNAGTSDAGIRFQFGGSHHGHYGGYGHHGGYYNGGYGYRSYTPSYRYQSYPRWHDTSHYDWHQGGFQRHGNHYHYQPGHYDFHQDGHWDH